LTYPDCLKVLEKNRSQELNGEEFNRQANPTDREMHVSTWAQEGFRSLVKGYF